MRERPSSGPMGRIYAAFTAAILGVFIYKAIFIPEIDAARARSEEAARLRESLADMGSRAAGLTAEARDPRVQDEIERIVSGDASPVESFRAFLAGLARGGAAVELGGFETEPAILGDGVEETPFRLRLRGGFRPTLALLEEIERAYPIVHVHSVSLTPRPEDGYAAETVVAGALYVLR